MTDESENDSPSPRPPSRPGEDTSFQDKESSIKDTNGNEGEVEDAPFDETTKDTNEGNNKENDDSTEEGSQNNGGSKSPVKTSETPEVSKSNDSSSSNGEAANESIPTSNSSASESDEYYDPTTSSSSETSKVEILKRLKWKRISIVLFGGIGIVAVIGLLLFTGPSFLGGILGCSAPEPTSTVAMFQSSGEDGSRLAVQATSLNNTEYISVIPETGDSIDMTGVGNTTTLTGLEQGETVNITATYSCGTTQIDSVEI